MRMCRRSLSGIDLGILQQLEAGPFHGLHRMAEAVECNDRRYVRRRLRRLRAAGVIVMKYPPVPCRGHRVVIRKRGRR